MPTIQAVRALARERWADMVRMARAKLGLSQGEFGALLGTDQAQVSRWENAKQVPGAHEVRIRIKNILAEDGEANGPDWVMSLEDAIEMVRLCPTPMCLMTQRFDILVASHGAAMEFPRLGELPSEQLSFYALEVCAPELVDQGRQAMVDSGFYDGKVIAGSFCMPTLTPGLWTTGMMQAIRVEGDIIPLCSFRIVDDDAAAKLGGEHIWKPLLRERPAPLPE